ncbi:Uncharacterized membrane protein, DUF2068 family [Nannocystis exedens]|uniref:Uncharacterized membrane protein, DUF2068 family n=1 Tax=Nannocystis exedens TaxID=54 RepID=A0A1I1VYE9_9BACT|nr:DUF2127 domain-containing protein [Nannocystis exedens]PCC72949.1 hypothetical protein NAEX_06035 [Nannocystis exedens]SFD87799.1 Uncharacterized membrane protein, DUF2068 family [Nannocystis exedens]
MTCADRRGRHERADGRRDRLLRAIALFKFGKAALLATVALGALELLRPAVAERAQAWLSALSLHSERAELQRLLAGLAGVSPGRLAELGVGSFLYGALFAIEGVGLWLGRRWAESVTVVTTLSFVPFEVHHLLRHPRATGASALALNLAVAAILIRRLRRGRAEGDGAGR